MTRSDSTRRPRPGFTTVELLAAIGIIMILIGIAFYGFSSMEKSSRRKLTAQMLATGHSVLREYERATLMKGIPTTAIAAPGVVTEGSPDRTGTAVKKTHEMMGLVRGIPVNQKALSQLPTEQFIAPTVPGEGPVLLDGWHNPILYVPTDGLLNVDVDGTTRTIKSPDGKPFFVSAGPDGSFSKGDDNVYSYDN